LLDASSQECDLLIFRSDDDLEAGIGLHTALALLNSSNAFVLPQASNPLPQIRIVVQVGLAQPRALRYRAEVDRPLLND